MIWILKIVLTIFLLGCGWAFRFFLKDWDQVRTSEGYGDITPWEKIKFNGVFFMLFIAFGALATFLLYFILSKIEITFILW